jgi:hypothetical protein
MIIFYIISEKKHTNNYIYINQYNIKEVILLTYLNNAIIDLHKKMKIRENNMKKVTV